MNKLKIELQHCYGIKKLNHEFDFSGCRTYVVYAPNGVMKTSFAKTLKAIAGEKENPCDQMDDTLISIYNFFIDDSSDQISPKEICVVEPYNEKAFNSEDKILTLLADEKTRKEYLVIYDEIESLKKGIIASLKKISGSGNYEAEITESFSYLKKKNIFEIFDTILDDIKSSKESFDFKYNNVFDPSGKVKRFLEENIDSLREYIEKYESLITQSNFFSKNKESIFGTTEAKNLSIALDGDNYFVAGHKLLLKERGEIREQKNFSDILNEEIEKIYNDVSLKETFAKIDKALDANQELKAFKKVIEKDKSILPRLVDYDAFRRDVWFSFLKKIEVGLESLVDLYNKKKIDLEKIIQKARDKQSEWEDAIDEFENRFIDMPFTIEIKNKADAVLNDIAPAIDIQYKGKKVERKKLIENILSQGEKRAFYILNVIFEIKSRQLQNKKTLFIIDDIADSFDYKNKYAIVEYLNDLSKEDNFCSIILTHNFDFYRTITSRLDIPRNNKLHAIKLPNETRLIPEVYQKAPFITWQNCMRACQYYDKTYTCDDAKKHIVALIPFVRNLIEYSSSTDSSTAYGDDFNALTCLLHHKDSTLNITFGDLKKIYKIHLSKDDFDSSIVDSDIVYNEIINLATCIGDEEFNLENKIILAMVIRYKAEEYMWSKIVNKDPISGHQTRELFKRYKKDFKDNANHKEIIKTLESVNIMTPENIHLNSFMYEPILDMGIDELKSLYNKVCILDSN